MGDGFDNIVDDVKCMQDSAPAGMEPSIILLPKPIVEALRKRSEVDKLKNRFDGIEFQDARGVKL